jgi:hypothetical protein
VIFSLMLGNLKRYLRKRPGSAQAGGEPLSPDAPFLALMGLMAVVLVVVIAVLWSAL